LWRRPRNIVLHPYPPEISRRLPARAPRPAWGRRLSTLGPPPGFKSLVSILE
jgi:hypothetical protein